MVKGFLFEMQVMPDIGVVWPAANSGLEGGAKVWLTSIFLYLLASQLLTSLKSVVWVELHWN